MNDKAKPIKKPVSKQMQEQEQKRQNKFFLVMSFVFLFALLVSLIVPVYYVPLFSNISARYGLSSDITRKLTLLDLALSSLGIETPNMAAAFKQKKVEYEPDIFLTSRFFNDDGNNRLINVKETYYHEYERTRKRPAEIAGIYRDGKEVDTLQIDGELKGVRVLPEGNSFVDFEDDGFTDFTYKSATATTASKDDVMGSKRRQVRGSFDMQSQPEQGQAATPNKPEPLPDFASSVYNRDENSETQTLENSRMIKPVVSGPEFIVTKPEGAIAQLVGDSSFTDTFASLTNFGGYEGALGYYVKDDLPQKPPFSLFGNIGQDLFTSYFYSHAAVGRKYVESSKHLSEIAFHGDEPQDEILIAKGQKQDKVPVTTELEDLSVPLDFVLTARKNIKECREAGERYQQEIASLKSDYENFKTQLKNISSNSNNMAKKGAPGCCQGWADIIGVRTETLRNQWNQLLTKLKARCKAIENKDRAYAESCKMDYTRDPNKDDCDSIDALSLNKGPYIENWYRCEKVIKWSNLGASKTFQGCGGYTNFPNDDNEIAARQDCVNKEEALFAAIDTNVQLEPKPGFMFVD